MGIAGAANFEVMSLTIGKAIATEALNERCCVTGAEKPMLSCSLVVETARYANDTERRSNSTESAWKSKSRERAL